MLRGLKNPGAAFEWNSSENRFKIADGIFLPEMSDAALCSALKHFADMGTIATK